MAGKLREKAAMLGLLSDENFSGAIVRGLLRKNSELELMRVQDVGLMQTPDSDILVGG